MIATTSITISSAPVALISTATTWGDLRGASQMDPTPFSAFNDGAARVYLSGSASTAAVGFPLLSSGTFTANLLKSDPVFAFTSAGVVSTVAVMAGRQIGGRD